MACKGPSALGTCVVLLVSPDGGQRAAQQPAGPGTAYTRLFRGHSVNTVACYQVPSCALGAAPPVLGRPQGLSLSPGVHMASVERSTKKPGWRRHTDCSGWGAQRPQDRWGHFLLWGWHTGDIRAAQIEGMTRLVMKGSRARPQEPASEVKVFPCLPLGAVRAIRTGAAGVRSKSPFVPSSTTVSFAGKRTTSL